MHQMRQHTYNLLRDDHHEEKTGFPRAFDTSLMVLIVLNVMILILDTLPHMPKWYTNFSLWGERVTMIIFTIEYLARLWIAPLQYPSLKPVQALFRYALSFMAIIDLLSILPFYLPIIFPSTLSALRLLRLIRLLRLFKINRYNHALDIIQRVFKKKAEMLVSSLLAVCVLLVISSILMFTVENQAQPQVFGSILDGLWWSLSSVTSANYGDIYPVTMLGKILSSIISLLGIGLFAVPTGIISSGFVDIVKDDNPAPSPTAPEEIKKYWDLRQQGIITMEEFEQKKEQLLRLEEDD